MPCRPDRVEAPSPGAIVAGRNESRPPATAGCTPPRSSTRRSTTAAVPPIRHETRWSTHRRHTRAAPSPLPRSGHGLLAAGLRQHPRQRPPVATPMLRTVVDAPVEIVVAQIPRLTGSDRLPATGAVDLARPHLRRPPLAEPLVLRPVPPCDRATRHRAPLGGRRGNRGEMRDRGGRLAGVLLRNGPSPRG
jgi:hypothetical protein